MAYEEERRFIQLFIRSERRERLLYELTSPKKRIRGLNRFCHQAEEFIDKTKIFLQGNDIESKKEFELFVSRHNELCRVISADLWIDGYFPLSDAVLQAQACFDAVIVIGSNFALVYTETMKGGRDKYLLFEQ